MPIETLFLDAGGVLVHPNWARVAETFFHHGVAVEAGALRAVDPRVRHELDTATMQTTTDHSRGQIYFDRILELAGVTSSAATDAALADLGAYHSEHNLWEQVPEEVVPALRRLRDGGLRLAVVSNSNGTVRAKLGRLGLAAFFDAIVDSTEEAVEKPDPRIFAIALERTGARADTTVHVGDLYNVDVVGARAAGLRAVLFDSAGLYADADCPRVPSLAALADWVASPDDDADGT